MNLLLIDDDRELIAVLTLALERAGFTVASAREATTALALASAQHPDLIVLSAPLRASDALALLGQLRRRHQAAIIMLTGRGDEDVRVAGLEQGADDYVTKPFSSREIVARIRALLRRTRIAPDAAPVTLTVGMLTLDVSTHSVTNAGVLLTLTPTEFRLLHYLMLHADQVISFTTLIQQVWGYTDPSATDVVRTAVYRLRRKLGDDPAAPGFIHSVSGIGFRLGRLSAPPDVTG